MTSSRRPQPSLMETEQVLGLTVLVVSTDEALGAEWQGSARSADLVQVRRPDPARWPELRAAGFIPRPDRVSWVASAPSDDEEFLGLLSVKGRQDVRRAMRRAASSQVEVAVRDTIDVRFYDEFLTLYQQQIDAMRYGLPIAVWERDRVLQSSERFFAVAASRHGRLVGACIGERRPEHGAAWIRFCAVDESRRRQSLARVLYLRASVAVGGEGYKVVVLGNDLGLYGQIAEVGLLGFKTRLGFVPRPSHEMTPGEGFDVADRIVSLRNLADPSVVLAYQRSVSEDLVSVVVGSDPRGLRDRIKLATGSQIARSVVVTRAAQD